MDRETNENGHAGAAFDRDRRYLYFAKLDLSITSASSCFVSFLPIRSSHTSIFHRSLDHMSY